MNKGYEEKKGCRKQRQLFYFVQLIKMKWT